MPHLKRSERLAQAKPRRQRRAAPIGQPTQSARHLRCPLCGLMARVEFFGAGPYTPVSRLQRWGGTLPSPTGMMAHRPGIMVWEPPEPITDEDRLELVIKIPEALALVERA